MSKVRFDGLDVTAMVACLQRDLAGRRVVNVYDGANAETYIFKLDSDSSSGDSNGKTFLLLESGVRLHKVSNFRAAPASTGPTPFAAKLRKHVRGLRLEGVRQLGADRVVWLQFGVGPGRHHVLLELYARGNVVLCDQDFVVLALLRSHVYRADADAAVASSTTTATTTGGDGGDTKEDKKDDTDGNHQTKNDAKGENSSNAVAVQVGQVFPVSYAATIEKNDDAGSSSSSTAGDEPRPQTTTAAAAACLATAAEFNAWAVPHIRRAASLPGGPKKKKKKGQGSNHCTPKTLLLQNRDSGVSQFGPALIEHCLRVAGGDPHADLVRRLRDLEGGTKQPQQPPQPQQQDDNDNDNNGNGNSAIPVAIWSDQEWARLKDALQNEGPRILESLKQTQEVKPGYILYKPKEDAGANKDENSSGSTALNAADSLPHADKLLLEFQPVLLKQHENRPHIAYDNFAAAVEDFFDHLQHQKLALRAAAAERAAQARLERVRADQRERLEGLRAQQEALHQEATVVQLHADHVDQALAVINSALDSGMDWDQLEQVVQVEQTQNKNPIALLIHRLDLEHDAMVLRLPIHTTDLAAATNIDENEPTVDVRISLKESAYANANALFAKFRSSKEKSQKTIEASTKALQAAEETARKQRAEAQKRSQQQNAAAGGSKRRALWFEKFHWFVTSDNYLAIAGRDAHQNELLVKRYLRPGDAYLHADVHGAASCVLRAKRRRRRTGGGTEAVPLSEQALREAGHFTICRSAAWTSRMITSAWWVESHQVSKTAPTGEYLTVGSFMIRGKKNFLPPSPLEMGLGVLFLLGDEESLLRHKNERRDFALMGVSDDGDEFEEQPKKGQGEITSETGHAQKETTKIGPGKSELPKAKPKEVTDPKPSSNGNTANHSMSVSDDADNDSDEDGDGKETCEVAVAEDGDAKPTQKKKGLSARDRRLIKKYGSLEAAEKAQAAREEDGLASDAPPAKSNNSAPIERKPAKRGKKAKQKKMMKKYADQDEEDRELAMLALQGGEKIKNRKKTPGSKRDPKVTEKQREVAAETVALLVKDASSVADRLSDEVRLLLAECVTVRSTKGDKEEVAIRWDKYDAETIEQLLSLEAEEAQVAAAKRLLELKTTTRVDNFSASLGGIIRTIRKHGYKELGQLDNESKAVSKQSEDKDKEYTQGKQSLDAEGAIDDGLDDDAVDDTTELSKLTGKPQAEDMLLSAVPICAPYQTLSQYAYRVKLTPGNMKRGKASKQCVDMFLKTTAKKGSEGVDRQLDLIKRVGDNDWVQVICGDVKLAAAGASKAVKQNKAKAKAKNKQKSKSGK